MFINGNHILLQFIKGKGMTGDFTLHASRLDELMRRLGAIETKLGITAANGIHHNSIPNKGLPFCSVPEVPQRQLDADVSPHHEALIRAIGNKWVNGTKLRYYFFENGLQAGEEEQKQLVRKAFDIWKGTGIGIAFQEVANISEAEIRIGFLRNGRSWSYLGRDIINREIVKQNEPTMNFGWDLTQDPRGVDVPVHEIGHTLGFPHEHQNPFSGIVWDEEAVYQYFEGAPNRWDRANTYYNILRKLPASEVEGSQWDPDSVMHYEIDAGLIKEPAPYRNGIRPAGGLSRRDVETALRFYPSINDLHNPGLEPFKSEILSLAPAEQKNFTIQPNDTRCFTIQTFGGADTVIVLFEDINGELRFIAGDDDSGTNRNARICIKLHQGKRYVLRVRLYVNYESDSTGLMMW